MEGKFFDKISRDLNDLELQIGIFTYKSVLTRATGFIFGMMGDLMML